MSNQPSTLFLDALRHHESGNLGTAERLYRKLVEKEPRNADAWYLAGYLAIQRQQLIRALSNLDKATQLRPDFADAQFNRANVLLELGREEEAVEGFRRAARCSSPRPEALTGLGLALMRLGNHAESVEFFEAALRMAPENSGAASGLAKALRRMGRDVEALRHAFVAAKADQDVDQLIGLAYEAMERNQMPLAHEAAQLATALRPQDAAALTLVAKLHHAGSLYDEAVGAARRAISLDPGLAEAHSILGQSLFRLDRLEEAVEALRLAPDDVEARHFLSLITGERDEEARLAYVRSLFDGCAETFEQVLVDGLGYTAPWVLGEELSLAGALDTPPAIIDLGCGTGLCARVLKPRAARIDGLDLAPRMVEMARASGLYDEVHEGEIVHFLASRQDVYDLAVAADVLIYVGESTEVFQAVRQVLRPGGWFAFSVEVDETAPVSGRSSGRFAHSTAYLHELATAAGFVVRRERETVLRQELKSAISGKALILQAV